ncbi:hypothetical protein GCM10009840_11390 [Pseudolysinimonas kribbensis]|uniref:Uncharacterized protein n=1 Tax=Pseudolysinimonas kribbensis TaxID=433641 RepID=A0ABQ6K580_9MICO|nr:hypothetical protein [Pseudolysinimonas kribbensis]GMA95573.1 hypothetical protein GCM10025881_23970 [Pseudolysinimonas kribbensis]
MNQYDVAQWMIEQIHERGRVHYAELAREGLARFGGAWVVVGVQGMRFSDPVLAAFRRRHAGLIRWQSPYWESLRARAEEAPIP